AEELESAGARLGFSSNNFTVSISGQSLSRDLPMIVSALAEELREPTFPAHELEKLKQRYVAAIKEDLEDTRSRAYERLTQLVFPEGNPFYQHPAETIISHIETVTAEDVRGFYRKYYGACSMILAIVGDVEPAQILTLVEQQLGGWQGAPAPEINLPET